MFRRVSGYGPAFEATALRLGVFTVRELRSSVDSVRPPGLGSATQWVKLQFKEGCLSRVREQSNRLPPLYSVVDDVDYWGKTGGSVDRSRKFHAWRGGVSVSEQCRRGLRVPRTCYRLYRRPLNADKLCRSCVQVLLLEQGVTMKTMREEPEASEENAQTQEEQ